MLIDDHYDSILTECDKERAVLGENFLIKAQRIDLSQLFCEENAQERNDRLREQTKSAFENGKSPFKEPVPPWKICWMEWTDRYPDLKRKLRVGALCITVKFKEEWEKDINPELFYGNDGNKQIELFCMSSVWLYAEKSPSRIGDFCFGLDKDKEFLYTRGGGIDQNLKKFMEKTYYGERLGFEISCMEGELAEVARDITFAFSIMNCKNIKLEDSNKELVRKTAKRRKKKGKKPLLTFKRLVIEAPGKSSKNGSKNSGNGSERAQHICRGHFADYTKGKGLFGRIKGRFWISQHLKGSASKGSVHKVYEVKKSLDK